ncbi:hypothetical protein [Rhodovulum visakhapatnamense]|uniref:Uncharacterized protein n=1 Tax=Rhodovulum visakhapatnamense TaxID=364297 RepID=A0ABS1RGI4_9RHOB|nr:hypothetical protein [Rhodovulum visakhapatnamense]MBL3569764.1 hypothetical protein [Rhodovulum visakhapatnamense]MBL3577846.1 hypothetical protein [Rhodovulum visakhapatnamense]
MQRSCLSRGGRALSLALTLSLGLAGCKEEEDGGGSLASPSRDAGAGMTEAPGLWLEAGDAEDPAVFLARVTGSDPGRVAASFPAVAARYRESPRMIANRVVQVWHEAPRTDLPSLLLRLAAGAGEKDRRASIGPLVQRYRVLRDRGLPHEEALTEALEHLRR